MFEGSFPSSLLGMFNLYAKQKSYATTDKTQVLAKFTTDKMSVAGVKTYKMQKSGDKIFFFHKMVVTLWC